MTDHDVVTKIRQQYGFGNDGTAGFIRVRRRDVRATVWKRATTSESFDIVRAVRIDGKPRHKFVLGLGSLKGYDRDSSWNRAAFFCLANFRMARFAGLNEAQRRHFIDELIRKGIALPEHADIRRHVEDKAKHRDLYPKQYETALDLERWYWPSDNDTEASR
jgi:hypothetical protein